MDTVMNIVQVLGTQALIALAIIKGYKLGQQMMNRHSDRQSQWLNIQKELELARIAQGTNLLGPKEIRVKPASMLDGLLVPDQR